VGNEADHWKGIFYFLSHRSLWKPLLEKIVPTMTLSVAVVAFMFIFCYLPQGWSSNLHLSNPISLTCITPASVLFFVNGPLAAFTTVLLTLSESSTLITILSKNFLIADALVDTFDGVLIARNETGIVAEGRQIKSGSDPINKVLNMKTDDKCLNLH
jgi:hypothetical protein